MAKPTTRRRSPSAAGAKSDVVDRTDSKAPIIAKRAGDSAGVGVTDTVRRDELIATLQMPVADLPLIELGRTAPRGGHSDNLTQVLLEILKDQLDATSADVLERVRELAQQRPAGCPIVAVGPRAPELPLLPRGLADKEVAWYRPRRPGVSTTRYPQFCRKVRDARKLTRKLLHQS